MAKLTPKAKAGVGVGGGVAAVIAAVIAIEGGFVDHPDDPGGATKHGITEAVARQCGYTGRMQDLTEGFAARCYEKRYVDKPGFRPIVDLSDALGSEAVDSGVNVGVARPAKWFQESLNHLNRRGRDYSDVVVDGDIGPATIFAYRQLQELRGEKKACELMVKLMDAKQAAHYMRLATDNSKFENFVVGWVDHRLWNVPLENC